MSPAPYTLQPALLFFGDCGLGSDPNHTGPCTGTYGPGEGYDHMAQPMGGILGAGKGMILAVAAAFFVLLAIRILLHYTRKAASGKTTAKAEEPCNRCGAESIATVFGEPFCDDCLADYRTERAADEPIDTFGVEDSAPFDGVCRECGALSDPESDHCESCGAGLVESAERLKEADELASGTAGDMQPCSVCGTPTPADELQGELFPACRTCADESEAEERRREIDSDGPDGDNPRGIGARDEGVRG